MTKRNKDERTNNYIENTTQKTKDRTTQYKIAMSSGVAEG
jgi:hypothetical protein